MVVCRDTGTAERGAEGRTFVETDHAWHLEQIDRLVAAAPDWLHRTDRRFVRLDEPGSRAAATEWWEVMTAEGGEGMVVKPASFVASGRRALRSQESRCAASTESTNVPSPFSPSRASP